MAGRPFGATKKDLPFRAALVRRLELTTNPDKLDELADALIKSAKDGDRQAINDIADRLDGKPTPLITTDEDGNVLARLPESDLISELRSLAQETGFEVQVSIKTNGSGKKQKLINGG